MAPLPLLPWLFPGTSIAGFGVAYGLNKIHHRVVWGFHLLDICKDCKNMVQLMKTRFLPIALCLCSSVVFMALLPALGAGGADKAARIYDESANGNKQVADAMVAAKPEHKHI